MSGTTTIQLSKLTSDEIQTYCIKRGIRKADFVNLLWAWFRPFQDEIELSGNGTPYLPTTANSIQQQNTDKATEQILSALQTIVSSVQPDKLIEHGKTIAENEMQLQQLKESCERLTDENKRLTDERNKFFDLIQNIQNENKNLTQFKNAARAELKRIKETQSYFGKVSVFDIPD